MEFQLHKHDRQPSLSEYCDVCCDAVLWASILAVIFVIGGITQVPRLPRLSCIPGETIHLLMKNRQPRTQ